MHFRCSVDDIFFEANVDPNLCLVETESDFAAVACNWKGQSTLDTIYDSFVFQLLPCFPVRQHFSNGQMVRLAFSQFLLALTTPLAADFSHKCSQKDGQLLFSGKFRVSILNCSRSIARGG